MPLKIFFKVSLMVTYNKIVIEEKSLSRSLDKLLSSRCTKLTSTRYEGVGCIANSKLTKTCLVFNQSFITQLARCFRNQPK